MPARVVSGVIDQVRVYNNADSLLGCFAMRGLERRIIGDRFGRQFSGLVDHHVSPARFLDDLSGIVMVLFGSDRLANEDQHRMPRLGSEAIISGRGCRLGGEHVDFVLQFGS